MGGLLNSLLVQFKGQRAINRLSEDHLIATVLEEKKKGEVDQVALAKAQMEAEGNVEKTEALYLKHRIQRIKDSDNATLAIADSIMQKTQNNLNPQDPDNQSFDDKFLGDEWASQKSDKSEKIARKEGYAWLAVLILVLVLAIVISSY
jgi:hypothetical protein